MSKEAMKLALEALQRDGWKKAGDAIRALEEALAEQPAQQEPVATLFGSLPVYDTSPPAQRTWVGLTDEEITDIWAEASPYYHEDDFARAIEAKLKQRNT